MAAARVLVAMVPDWPVMAAGCPTEVPAVVVMANRVVAVSAAARVEGVRLGLRRREAQGRCPELRLIAADAGRDARGWEPVVVAMESSLVPAVEVLGAGALAFSTRGPSRYFGGDEALGRQVADVVDRVVGQAGCCRVGIADGRFAAGLAAGDGGAGGGGAGGGGAAGRVAVVAPGGSRAWLARHPVAVLGSEHEALADLLVRLGIRTLGDLAGLPAPSVLGRFGPAGVAAHRLARGLDDRPLGARTPPPDLVVAAELDPPEQRVEAAAFVAKALADELLERLGSAGLAATKVAIEIETEHGERLVRHWRHEGVLTAAALSERARWQLDGWLSGSAVGGGGSGGGGRPSGGLTLVRLTPEEVRPDLGRQLGFWGGQADSDARAARALARIQGILGPEAVATAVLGGGRGFAEQARLVPWGDARSGGDDPGAWAPPRPRAARGRTKRQSGPAESPPWPGRLARPSPAQVHQPPRPVGVVDAHGNPVSVSGRGALSAAPSIITIDGAPGGQVAAWAGPWPLEERWWEGGGRRRARLQILLQGGDAHLITREAGEWWVEATYD